MGGIYVASTVVLQQGTLKNGEATMTAASTIDTVERRKVPAIEGFYGNFRLNKPHQRV
ncbi:MAG: hypothetical protein KME27_25490 [Lyngbya sp. HA4199-MV5]|nr:hypothetical protein [Lyngbya sp. HA4199-MV5]